MANHHHFFATFKPSAASPTQPPPPGIPAPPPSSYSSELYRPESAALRYYEFLGSPAPGTEGSVTAKYGLTSKSNYLSGSEILRFSSAVNSGYGGSVTSYLGSENGKRPAEALYNQTVLGAYNTIGQNEAWYTANSLTKRPRLESASNLPIYPQRPGEKDCAYYMQTRTCKFGEGCKFDHPIWVPEGGIPDWKEVPPASDDLPERPGEPDCPYFLKTKKCKFGMKCKFNHPKDEEAMGASEKSASELPERPSEPPCAFYIKTGKCKFGGNCKFHHPKDIQIPSAGQEISNGEHTNSADETNATTGDSKPSHAHNTVIPAVAHNSKGLPMRLGAEDCPFYMKTGSCKYGISCRYNHPDRNIINPPMAAISNPFISSSTPSLNIGVVNPAASIYQSIDPSIAQPMLGVGTTVYAQRPGQTECDYYMKTGLCKFGDKCKFHHPFDRSAPISKPGEPGVKLTPAGLPRREGATICAYYLKTGTCKFGATCKFDHPPPGEVLAMSASQGASNGEEVTGNEKEAQTGQEQQQ